MKGELESIEQRLGVTLPESYKALASSGRIGPEASDADYLWLFEAEWLPLERLRALGEGLPACLIPFAQTGAGDLWCFDASRAGPSGLPVIECPHDSDEGRIYAPSFDAFVLRRALDFADGGYDDLGEARRVLRGWAAAFSSSFPESWTRLLGSIAEARELETAWGPSLIVQDDVTRFLREELHGSALDQSIRWRDSPT